MRRLLAALLLVAGPALAQTNGWQETKNGWGEIQTATGSSTVPVGCVAGSVALFLGSPVAAGCDAGLTYDAATDTLSPVTVAARNVVVTALATPTITSPLVVNGTPGVTTYGYKRVDYLADGTSTAASAEVTIATGNATLSATNSITVSWPALAGSVSTRLYRTTGGTAPPRLLYTGTATSYVDVGAAGTAQTPATGNTTGVVTAKRVIAGDGTAAAPGIGGTTYQGTGFFWSSVGLTMVTTGSNEHWFCGGGYCSFAPNVVLAWSDYAAPITAGTKDLFLARRGPGSLRQGAGDSAAPVAQHYTVQGVVAGTADTAGQPSYRDASVSTGAGAGGALVDTTTFPGAASTAQNAASHRRYTSSGWTTLTESSATPIATLTYPASTIVGAEFLVTIHAADASNNQGMTYRVAVNSVRDATGNTQSVAAVIGTPPVAAGSGTLTSAFSVTEGATGVSLNATAVSSLTQTTLRATFQAVANGAGLVVAPAGF